MADTSDSTSIRQSTFQFRWLSPMGVAVVLFLFYGATLSFALGIQWTIITNTNYRKSALLTSERTDTVVFGQPPAVLYKNDPALFPVMLAEEDWRDGMAFCLGITVAALAWFGLRRGQRWALWTLSLVGLGFLPYARLYIEPVLRSGAPWSLRDLPPVLATQVLVGPVAVLLGWIGMIPRTLRRGWRDQHQTRQPADGVH